MSSVVLMSFDTARVGGLSNVILVAQLSIVTG